MAHEEKILEVMESIKIADKHVIGQIMASRNVWKAGTSAVNNSYKALMDLTALGKLIKGDGYFKTPDCKSSYAEHSQLLTKCLSRLFQTDTTPIIYREHSIKEVGLRPDAVCLLIRDGQGLAFILEVVNHEEQNYLDMKINTWKNWPGALDYLSQIFGYKVPHYDVLVAGEKMDGAYDFDDYMEEML